MTYSQFFIIFLMGSSVQGLITDRCQAPLGMETNGIPDEHITASSYFDGAVNAIFARAKVERGGGAWCPREMVHNEGNEYLEINLVSAHVITKVEVQGRFGNGQGMEFAENYKLQYWRPGLPHWITYRNGAGIELMEGNTNTYLAKSTQLTPPIIGSRIRFLPFSHYPRTVCMRVELYGCSYEGGLVSYSMPDGSGEGGLDGLRDVTYDGVRDEGFLSGGLGQLTDGETGHTNFRVDSLGKGKGYEWVGWKNDSFKNGPVELNFKFDQVRNFSSMSLYVNNFFTTDTMVFWKADISFSVEGETFTSSPRITYLHDTDRIFENARNITIRLNGATARIVKVQLYFALKWIMVSEVGFDSIPCRCNATDAVTSVPKRVTEEVEEKPVILSSNSPSKALLSGLIALVVVFGLLPVLFAIYYRKQRGKTTTKAPTESTSDIESRRRSIKMKDFHLNFTCKSNIYSKAKSKIYGRHLDEELGVMYQEPYKNTLPGVNYYCQTQITNIPNSVHDTDDSVDYAVPDVNMTPPPFTDVYTSPLLPISRPLPMSPSKKAREDLPPPIPPLPPPPSQQYFSAPKLCQPSNIQGVTGGVIYAISNSNAIRDIAVKEIPRHKINIIEDLGNGIFGNVQLCEVDANEIYDKVPSGSWNKKLVAVKSLKAKAPEAAKEDFQREVQVLSQLDDRNIVRLLGIISESEPFSMILEYMDYGDLHQFLQKHGCPEISPLLPSGTTAGNCPMLSVGALIHIASQIASGMKYLERLNFIHRDLAARNCLVGHSLVVKVSDFGMSRPLYSNDYYRLEGRALLTIRWMAWESVLQGRFTAKSDVWAFGVTLWEILTMARQQPYDELSDEGVLENVSHCLHDNGDGMMILPAPPQCHRDMYDMMLSCWRPAECERPPFWEIHMFLQRKNLSYSLDYEE